jgi:hypothetical protein
MIDSNAAPAFTRAATSIGRRDVANHAAAGADTAVRMSDPPSHAAGLERRHARRVPTDEPNAMPTMNEAAMAANA